MAKKKATGITIPGTKVKAPPWAIAAAGGGVLAVLFLMRDSDDGQPGSGASFGFFAEEVAQRMDDERRIFEGALEDINDQLADLRDQQIEDQKPPESKQPTSTKSERGSEETFEYITTYFEPEPLDQPGYGLNESKSTWSRAEDIAILQRIVDVYARSDTTKTVEDKPDLFQRTESSRRLQERYQPAKKETQVDRWVAASPIKVRAVEDKPDLFQRTESSRRLQERYQSTAVEDKPDLYQRRGTKPGLQEF